MTVPSRAAGDGPRAPGAHDAGVVRTSTRRSGQRPGVDRLLRQNRRHADFTLGGAFGSAAGAPMRHALRTRSQGAGGSARRMVIGRSLVAGLSLSPRPNRERGPPMARPFVRLGPAVATPHGAVDDKRPTVATCATSPSVPFGSISISGIRAGTLPACHLPYKRLPTERTGVAWCVRQGRAAPVAPKTNPTRRLWQGVVASCLTLAAGPRPG